MNAMTPHPTAGQCQPSARKQPSTTTRLQALCGAAAMAILANSTATADSIDFSQARYTFNEAQGTVQLPVNYVSNNGITCPFEISVLSFEDLDGLIVAGNATPGDNGDYILETTTLTFPVAAAGTLSTTVTLTLNDDGSPERTEDIVLSFGSVRVLDDCASPTIDRLGATEIDIYDNYTPQTALSLEGQPGETVSATFDINTLTVPLAISSLREFDGQTSGPAAISPKTATEAGRTVITYSYSVPEDAVTGQSLTDTITIAPEIFDLPIPEIANEGGDLVRAVGSIPQEIEIPVTINVVASTPTQSSLRPIERAWQSLCNNNQDDAAISAHCAQTPGLRLTAQQERDLSPEEMAAMIAGSVRMANAQMRNVRHQQRARRAGVTGVDLNRLSFMLDGQDIPLGRLMDHYLEQPSGGAAGDTSIGSRWSVFATGRIDTGDKDASDYDGGYDFDTHGLTLGADYRITDQMFLGSAVGYAQMASNFGNDGGDLDIEAGSLIVYGGYYTPNNVYIDAAAFYGLNDYAFTREIASFATRTEGDTDGDQYAVSLSIGMDVHAGKLLITPYGRFEYLKNEIDDYRETGGDGLALEIENQDAISKTSALGGRFSYAASMRWGVLTPTAHAEWIHEFNDDQREIIARFVHDPNGIPFSTPVGEPDSDFINWGLGLSATLPAGRSLFINYEGISAQQDLTQHTIHLGGRMEF